MTKRHRGPGLIVLAALFLSSCGAFNNGGGEGSAPTPTLAASVADKPCLALTRSEAEAALGSKVKEGVDPTLSGSPTQIPVVGMKFCRFGAAQPAGPFVDVGVTKAYAREVFDKYKNDPSVKPTPVPGVGDEALSHQFAASHSLVILDGDAVVGIYLGFVQKDQQPIALGLAKKAMSRI